MNLQRFCAFLMVLVLTGVTGLAQAQQQAPSATAPAEGEEAPPQTELLVIDDIPESFFFSRNEVVAIKRAMSGFESALPSGEGDGADGEAAPPPNRQIRVSGILYVSPDVWTVWVNGRRVIPGYLLPEIVDIRVERRFVYLEWYDQMTDTIISITLRPHQTYDIDTGILLPG